MRSVASLRKFKDSKYWFAIYRDATGKQCNRSTKLSHTITGADPKKRASDLREQRQLALEVARTYEDAERGHPTEQQVQKVLHAIFAKVNKRRMEPAVTETFFSGWLERVKTRRGAGGTHSRYEAVVNRFLDTLGARKTVQLADILPDDVQAFVDAQAGAGKASATVKIEHKILSAVFADALKQGRVANNPAAAVSVPIAAGESRKPFEWPQVRAILATAKGEWKTAVLLGVFTGARLGDCVTMQWRHVDLPASLIRFRPSKTKAKGGEIVVPLHADLEAHLMALPMPEGAGAAEQPLCPTLAAASIGGRAGLSRKFKEILIEAGIENEQMRQGVKKGRSFSAYSFHSLRHTFNTVLMNRGVSQELRMRLSGHKSEEINARYSHAEIATLRAAVAKLPGVTS